MAAAKEVELINPPADGITSLCFSAALPDLLLASSWDSTVRVYDAAANREVAHVACPAAVLDACFLDAAHCASGGLDRAVRLHDINAAGGDAAAATVLGTHGDAVRRVVRTAEGMLVSGGWDAELRWWDTRSRQSAAASKLPGKVFAMSACAGRVVAATSDRHVLVYDVRNTAAPEQSRESSLKYQTRSLACYPDATGYAIASVEGRVAMEYFDTAPEAQARKYAFKCHRATSPEGADVVYPINALAFHPAYGTFASGGCDGHVYTWDGRNKKRLSQSRQYPAGVAALAFNASGTALAVGSSYTWEEGEKPDAPKDRIFIRTVSDAEVKPKTRAPAQ